MRLGFSSLFQKFHDLIIIYQVTHDLQTSVKPSISTKYWLRISSHNETVTESLSFEQTLNTLRMGY